MTQRIFDIENEEDMKLLWSILPEEVYKIGKNVTDYTIYWRKGQEYPSMLYELNIDLHDKKEITRPAYYEDMIGCVGWFWDDSKADDTPPCLGVLTAIAGGEYYTQVSTWGFDNFRPAKKSELKFWEELDK